MLSTIWNDYLGKRNQQHPTQLPAVEESISQLEKTLSCPKLIRGFRMMVVLSALFFASQVLLWLKYRVFTEQPSLPYPRKPHVEAYLKKQNEILSSYHYYRDTGVYGAPIEVGMELLLKRGTAVIKEPEFVRVDQSLQQIKYKD